MMKAKKVKVAPRKEKTPTKAKKAQPPKAAKPKAATLKPVKPKAAVLKAKKIAEVKLKPAAKVVMPHIPPPVVKPKPVLPPVPKEIKKEIPLVVPKEHKEPPRPVIKEYKEAVVIKKVEPKVEPKVEHKVEPKVEHKIEPKAEPEAPPQPSLKELELDLPITLKDLAIKLQEKPSVIIKMLMGMRIMTGINQNLQDDIAAKICEKYGYRIKKAPGKEEQILMVHEEKDSTHNLISRSPIVTFMGHVDHGKTSLMDAIRKTKVVESEHGGITQHIGAYRVSLPHGEITFLDTPGHEAFTAMRSRGASITDIVVLVVAADDGVMPQTQEAIDHARAAGVPIVVALNKVDKPQANIERVKKQLSELDLAAEDWGGKTITVPVSAKTGDGIDNLLEMILLEAQMLELKANPNRLAKGIVIEAKMSKGRGPVSTLLVQNGTLHLNDNIIIGNLFGKVRAMFNDRGGSVTAAKPGIPVEVLGISGIPEAGEQFFSIADEKEAKELVSMRQEDQKQRDIKTVKRVSLEELHAQIEAGKIKDLKIVIKADVQGSLEAIRQTLDKLNVSEIKLDIIHTGVGNINYSDAILATASNALILGFNVISDDRAKELADKEGIDVRIYNIIYELANDIKAAIEGMLEPKLKKVFLGKAEIRKVFKLSRSGIVAGCFVTKGKFNRNALVTVLRNGAPVFEGKLSALKRFKDDVRDVAEGFECGMSFVGFDQMMEGDIIEAYEIEKIARKL